MAKAKGIGIGALVLLAVAVWWFFIRDADQVPAELAADIATGKQVPIPQFGTDNVIDAADAVAATSSLPLSLSNLSTAGSTGFPSLTL